MLNPRLYRNAIAIIEPWEHVGHNPLGEPVRASVNVAYIAQKIADCDSIMFPMWHSGSLNLEQLIPVLSAGVAIVVEGAPLPYGSRLPWQALTARIKKWSNWWSRFCGVAQFEDESSWD